jgi:carbamoylphosphate synthase large subunit
MKTRILRQTVRTYTDDELKNMETIYKWSEFETKLKIVRTEMKRRKRANYKDETIDPKISINKRLSLV